MIVISLEGLCEGEYSPDEIMDYINNLNIEVEKWKKATDYYQKNWLDTMEILKRKPE